MTKQKSDLEARQTRASLKEAIGKITGDDAIIAEGAAEKAPLATARPAHNDDRAKLGLRHRPHE